MFSSNRIFAFALLALTFCGLSRAADELRIDNIMHRDPELIVPDIIWIFQSSMKQLWQEALHRPEGELQRLAADTVAIAHRYGMQNLDSLADDLVKILQQPDTSPTVRRAAAHALVGLDAKQHTAALVQGAARYGLDLQTVVEPALARWGNDSLRDAWRQRLTVNDSPPRLRLLAMDGLGALRDSSSKPTLLAIVMNTRLPNNERLAAAQSLARIGEGGMLEEARKLLATKGSAGFSDRVLAVQLLSGHRDEMAMSLIAELATDPEPAVAAAAMNHLFEVDPPRVFPLAPEALKNADVNVRRIGVRALVFRGDTAAIETIGPLLNDPNPSLRRMVAKSLFDLAQKSELRPTVIAAAERVLAGDQWRGLEQAALIVGHLGHKPAADRLIVLLSHPRDEVSITSGWAMRQFKIPETIPTLLAHSKTQHQRHLDLQTPLYQRPGIYAQQSQLFQLFGEVKLAEAESLMREYVPKAMSMGDSRPAACWALGKIHEGNGPADLTAKFAERLSDVNSMPPETEPVRLMCAVGIGRMKAEAQLAAVRRFAVEGSDVGLACRWAIKQITGEEFPKMEPLKRHILGFFLESLDD